MMEYLYNQFQELLGLIHLHFVLKVPQITNLVPGYLVNLMLVFVLYKLLLNRLHPHL